MQQVKIETVGAVARVTIANPPQGLMNAQTVTELIEAVARVESDSAVRAVVFTGGVPGVFIRHYDVAEIVALAEALQDTATAVPPGDTVATNRLMARLERSPLPMIAAINGHCMGGGYEFALSCDVRLAGPGDYTIGLPEMQVDIFPGAGGTQRLARAVGTGPALDMILRGRVFGPQEAARRGLVHDYVAGDVVAEAMDLAASIAARPRQAVESVKTLVRSAHTRPISQGIVDEWAAFVGLLAEDPQAAQTMRGFVKDGGKLGED